MRCGPLQRVDFLPKGRVCFNGVARVAEAPGSVVPLHRGSSEITNVEHSHEVMNSILHARRQETCVHPILPGPGKDFWLTYKQFNSKLLTESLYNIGCLRY